MLDAETCCKWHWNTQLDTAAGSSKVREGIEKCVGAPSPTESFSGPGKAEVSCVVSVVRKMPGEKVVVLLTFNLFSIMTRFHIDSAVLI